MKISQEILKKTKTPKKTNQKTNMVQSKKSVVGYMKLNLWGFSVGFHVER